MKLLQLLKAVLLAADGVIIPVVPEAFAVSGIQPLLGQVRSYHEQNPGLEVVGIVASRVPTNRRAAKDALGVLDQVGVPVFKTVIHEATEVNDAHNAGRPALVGRRSRLTEEYEALGAEVLAAITDSITRRESNGWT